MELQGGTYDSAMAMPYSRRNRFVEQKRHLEENRRQREEQAASRMRARAQTRRR